MQSRAELELEKDLIEASSRVLAAGNEEFGTSFYSWQDLGNFLFEKDPDLCFDKELQITDELVEIQSKKGLNSKHCAVMEREGKRNSAQAFLDYWRQQYRKGEAEHPSLSVLDAHLVILSHIQPHGNLFLQSGVGDALEYTTEETKNMFGITQEVMADHMLKLVSEEPSIGVEGGEIYGNAIDCVAKEANRAIQWACYRQYEYLAHYCSPRGVDRKMLRRIRAAWSIPEFLAEEDSISGTTRTEGGLFGRLSRWLAGFRSAKKN